MQFNFQKPPHKRFEKPSRTPPPGRGLVEGPTLADRIRQGPIPIEEALAIAMQLADALEFAHERGIVHRDLKPANVKVSSDNAVKVLDFGLAKALETETSAADLADSPTISRMATQAGVLLGTAAYMSPEQARGKPVDRRADIWGFGCVLYEMLTGRMTFRGEGATDTLAAVIRAEPDWSLLPAATPPHIRDLLRRCLQKDARQRLQAIGDARIALEEVLSGTVAPVAPPPRAQPRTLWLVSGVAGVVVLAVVIGSYVLSQRGAPRAAESTASVTDFQVVRLTTSGNASAPAISPDGKYVAYAQLDGKDAGVWIRQTATSSNVQIVAPGTFLGRLYRPTATVTPDGTFVDVVRVADDGKFSSALWRVPFLGGTPKRVLDDISSAVGWSPDGRSLAFVRAREKEGDTALVVADADGSHERVLAGGREAASAFVSAALPGNPVVRPAWSPDGRLIAMSGFRAGAGGGLQFHVLFTSVADGSVQAVPTPSGSDVAWLDASSLVLSMSPEFGALVQLWRLSYPRGELTRLTNDLSSYGGVSLTADRTTLVTGRTDANVSIWVGDGDAANGTEAVPQARTKRVMATA